MSAKRLLIQVAAIATLILALAVMAQAQATCMWVAAGGNDVDPCSRTAPCATYSGAISKTATNGEINVINHGAYGTVTITKSITIDGTGNFASSLASGVVGFSINITAAADTKKEVRLRGLHMNGTGGAGGPNTGTRGVRVLSALAVHVEDCLIEAFANDGIEVIVGTAMTTELHVRNTVIRNCVSDGISLTNSVVGGLVLATIDNTQLSNNGTGLNASSRSRAAVRNSTISTNSSAGVTTGGTSDVDVSVVGCTLTYNPSAVLVNLGTARVARSLITGNTTGLNNVAGVLETYQNNRNRGNTNNTLGAITPAFEG
jgi:hypothetical protein